MPTLTEAFLRSAICRTFVAWGAPDGDAQIVADHLVDAELCGVASHGILCVPQYVEAIKTGRVKPNAEVTIRAESAATACLDGGQGFGQVAGQRTAEKAIEPALG